MTTKAERNLEEELGPSPWDLYADRDEPWKDHELMLKLEDKFDYKYEIAHVLGASANQISYWMEKAHNNYTPTLSEDEFECIYFEVCKYKTYQSEEICTTCLDLVRENATSGPPQINADSPAEMLDHIEELYDEHDDYEVNKP